MGFQDLLLVQGVPEERSKRYFNLYRVGHRRAQRRNKSKDEFLTNLNTGSNIRITLW